MSGIDISKQEYWNNRALQTIAELEKIDDYAAAIGATVLKAYVNTSGCSIQGLEETIIGCEQYLLVVRE